MKGQTSEMMGLELPSSSMRRRTNIDSDTRKKYTEQNHFHGLIKQLKLLILILHRGVRLQYSFRLRKKVVQAKKFDDALIFEYLGTDRTKEYLLLQAKQKKNESDKITAVDLLGENDSGYSLIEYFFYFQYSKREKMFENGTIKNIIIFTNINLDFESLRNAQIEYEEVVDEINILTHESAEKRAKQYKINENFSSKLKLILENYHLTKLAKKLTTSILKSCIIRHHQEDILQVYHAVLAKEVIDVENKRFLENFIKNEDISDEGAKFRTALEREIEVQSNGKVTLENINEAIIDGKVINGNKVGLNLSKKFGNGEYKGWPDNSNDEIKEYLNCLLFATNQPNEQKLDKVIQTEISRDFGLDSVVTEHIYNKLVVKMLDWIRGKRKDKFLSFEDGKEFFELAQKDVPIRFNVREPINTFVGRTKKLEELHAALQRGERGASRTASLGGLGGVGKSELVRKYISEYGQSYDNNIIWLNAESHESLAQCFRSLARDKLHIGIINANGEEKATISIVEDVYAFFASKKSLFIFDNAVQRRSVKESDGGIDRFWPFRPTNSGSNHSYAYSSQLHILITSCNQKWEGLEPVVLDTFTEEEAVEFLKKTLLIENNEQDTDIIELAKKLQYFPLALHQAVAYIIAKDTELKNVDSEFKIRDYLKCYEEKTKELLNFSFSGDGHHFCTKTTFVTWEMTIERIKEKKHGEEAIKILDILAYVLPDGNPSRMFLNLVDHDEEKLGSILTLLKQYSMVNSGQDQAVLKIHRLVQQVIRLKQEDENREKECLKKALNLFKDNINYTNVDQAVSVWDYASDHEELVKDFIELPTRVIEQLRRMLRYSEAHLFGEKTITILKRELGFDNIETLEMMKKTAIVLFDQDKYEDASRYFQEVRRIQAE